MTYRVQLRPSPAGYDVWVPELPGCASTGKTEEEAIRNIQNAIRGRLDIEELPIDMSPIQEREVTVARPRLVVQPSAPEELQGPVPLSGWTNIVIGGIVFALGLIGLVFFFAIERQSSPVLLFLPMIVLAAGALALFFWSAHVRRKAQDQVGTSKARKAESLASARRLLTRVVRTSMGGLLRWPASGTRSARGLLE